MALSLKRIERATEPGRYFDAHGLYLQINAGGAKSWLLRYVVNGRERWMGLGPLHTFTLEEARERARRARQLLHDGRDPLDERRAEQERAAIEASRSVTFEQVTLAYFDAHSPGWTNAKHRQQFITTMRDHVFPAFGQLPVAAIDVPMVLGILRPIWSTKNATAQRVRNRIASVLDYATASKYRTGDNPARWEGHLEHLLARPDKNGAKHMAALPYAEVGALLGELRAREGISLRALEFAILTSARSGEVRYARWEEIDLKAAIWTIPAARMKGRREHRVPLAPAAVKLLAALPREGEFVFVGAKERAPISERAMFKALRQLHTDATVHGFRSTFRDWASEQTSYPHEVCEQALAHTVGSAVERAYRRTDLFDKRRRLMEEWATYCARPSVASAKDVIPLRSRS